MATDLQSMSSESRRPEPQRSTVVIPSTRTLTLLLGVSLGDWLVGEAGMRMGCGHDADRLVIELSA